jgi:anti-sigma regulatory factor (Ser/Thr protein kinase)
VDTTRRIPVTERSQVSAARALVRELAARAGMTADDQHRAGLVATELTTNLVKHTSGGELLVRIVNPAGEIEMVAVDRGPGIADLASALTDGHSSAGSMGTGLGAIRRLSSSFDLYSQPGTGTVTMSRVRATHGAAGPSSPWLVGAISLPKPGEQFCGDAWTVQAEVDAAVITVADGLGHGAGAREAADAALAIAGVQGSHTDGVRMLQQIHAGIRHTRGAACAVIHVRRQAPTFTFAGVGNVTAVVSIAGTQRHVISSNGTLGHSAAAFRSFEYPWASDAVLIVHTDGLGSHWAIDRYPGLLVRHPSIIAAVLYRDFSRQRDDVTVLVAREAP